MHSYLGKTTFPKIPLRDPKQGLRSPEVRTLCFQRRGHGFDPWSERRSHVLRGMIKSKQKHKKRLEADTRVLKALSSPAGEKPVKPGYLPFPKPVCSFPQYLLLYFIYFETLFLSPLLSPLKSAVHCAAVASLNYCEQRFFLSSHYIK